MRQWFEQQTWAIFAVAVSLSVGACHSTRPVTSPQPATIWNRTVTVSEDLREMTVETCFGASPPDEIEARHEGELDIQIGASRQRVQGHRVAIGRGVDCISEHRMLNLNGAGLSVLEHRDWLWQARGALNVVVRTQFYVPAGVEVSVAWPRTGNTYWMDETAMSWGGFTVIGRFVRREILIDHTTLDVAHTEAITNQEVITNWLTRAVHNLHTLDVPWEADRVQIVLLPRALHGVGVGFGLASRGGGRSALFLIDPRGSPEEFSSDWQATHELVHMVHPVFYDADAWLREGIATYYQEILRARGGTQTEEEAWRHLRSGIANGNLQRSGRSLASESAQMQTSHAYTRVYWWGAALVFLADVTLHQHGKSMDVAIAGLRRAAASQPSRAWSAQEAARVMDEATGVSVWQSMIQDASSATDYPEVETQFRSLGVFPGPSGTITLHEDAFLSRVRQRIARRR
jgi:hypothetical protein